MPVLSFLFLKIYHRWNPVRESKSQKFGFWLHGESDLVAEAPLYSAKTHASCSLSSRDVIEPYFLEDVSGDTQTGNAQRYRKVLAKFRRAL